MKNFLILIFGFLIGTSFSWPGAISIKGWRCFFNVIEKVSKEEISFKTTLALSPKYLMNSQNNSLISKIRIVSDACFR